MDGQERVAGHAEADGVLISVGFTKAAE